MACKAVPTKRQDLECRSPACERAARFISDSLDTSVEPCQDFYQYACGKWLEKHPIPDDRSRYSMINLIQDEVSQKLIEVLKNVSKENYAQPVIDAANLFLGCIDEDAREAQGLDPLKTVLDSFGGWPVTNPLWSNPGYRWEKHVAIITRTFLIRPIISVMVALDANHTTQHIIKLRTPKFGLGKNQLLESTSSDRNKNVIAAYKEYIIATAKLLNPNGNGSQVANDADEIIQFESALAKLIKPEKKRSNAESQYHKMTVAEVQRETENTYFKWTDFLNEVLKDFPHVTNETEIVFSDAYYFKNVVKLAHETNPRILANYIGWILLGIIGDHSTKQFRKNTFELEKILKGVQKQPALERQCVETTSGVLEFAVGRLYVDKYFTEEKKRVVEQLVEDIRSTYRESLTNNTWMDENTRNKALEKQLDAMSLRLAYPSWIKNDTELNEYYSGVQRVQRDKYFMSVMQIRGAEAEMNFRKWNKPVEEKDSWEPPQIVNAFYQFSCNCIKLPAGILNLPFYELGRPQALNFGEIGTVIGHEIGHGFDDDGSEYDKDGNIINWWSKETKEEFSKKADCFRKQYASYVEPTTNLSLNGKGTVGENIGDNGGIRNVFLAYKTKKFRPRQRQSDEVHNKRLPGVSATPDQLFFLGYAMVWCAQERTQSMELSIQYSSHTPNKFRVNVPLSNSEGFAKVFNCPSGSPMNPVSKCVLW